MVTKKAINIIPFLTVINSIYLSNAYLESFMLIKRREELINNMILALFAPIFILSVSLTINFLKKNRSNIKSKKIDFFRAFIIMFVMILFASFFCLMIYDFLKSNSYELFSSSFFICVEIVSIAFAIQKIREKAIMKIIGYIAFWAYLAIMCTVVTGILVKYFGFVEFDKPDVQIVFIGIFYHLLNACFLFYNALPTISTQ